MSENYTFFDSVKESMEKNEPHSRWQKVQLAKVLLKIIDPLTGRPDEIVITGNSVENPEASIYNCWSAFETAYLERNNRSHILNGTIIRYGKKMELEDSVNSISDEQLRAALDKKFMAANNLLKKFTSPVPVKRMLDLANEMNKPVATIKAIETRLAELQQEEYA